jgi:3'(2'), 5'-bisphosphate nucleotidase
MSVYQEERKRAIEAVVLASRICQHVQKNLIDEASMSKKDKSPVTIADFGAQAIVSLLLQKYFPDVPMVGEEDASSLREDNNPLTQKVFDSVRSVLSDASDNDILEAIDYGTYEGGAKGRHWCLDPIDGTKGFLRGDQYAVALALIEDGEVVLGVLGCPNLLHEIHNTDSDRGSLFVAEKGEGAQELDMNGEHVKNIHVDQATQKQDLVFCESVEKAHTSQSDSAKIAERLGIQNEAVRIDSQCKYAIVARGDASIYLRLPTRPGYQEKIWDHGAGVIVIEEAGGRVSDIFGAKLDFSLGRTLANNKGVVVTSGALHDDVVKAVQHVLDIV